MTLIAALVGLAYLLSRGDRESVTLPAIAIGLTGVVSFAALELGWLG